MARATGHLRNISVQVVPLRSGVHIEGGDFMAVWQGGQSLESLTHLQPGDELSSWTNALKAAREQPQTPEPAASFYKNAELWGYPVARRYRFGLRRLELPTDPKSCHLKAVHLMALL